MTIKYRYRLIIPKDGKLLGLETSGYFKDDNDFLSRVDTKGFEFEKLERTAEEFEDKQ